MRILKDVSCTRHEEMRHLPLAKLAVLSLTSLENHLRVDDLLGMYKNALLVCIGNHVHYPLGHENVVLKACNNKNDL